MSHDNHGNPHLQHHWDSMRQQFGGAKLGMWLFLAQEILFFGGLFCAYAVFRGIHPELFAWGSQFLDTTWGAINTVVLLVSSLTMALGVRCAQLGQRRALMINLALTFVCACGFMVIKGFEYNSKYEHGTLWGNAFQWQDHPQHPTHPGSDHAARGTHENPGTHQRVAHAAAKPAWSPSLPAVDQSMIRPAPTGTPGLRIEPATDDHTHEDDGHHDYGPRPDNAHIFFSIYFGMTGLHAIHVLAGMIMLIWLFVGAAKGKYSGQYFTPVDCGGLYWHLVDLVWIFLFPLLYLI